MNQFIQTLESRAMFSAVPMMPLVWAPLDAPAGQTVKLNQPLYFQGTDLRADGSLEANIFVTLKPNARGGTADVLVINPKGKISTAHLVFNAQGAFNLTETGPGHLLQINGQLSADQQTITATGATTNNGVASPMVLSLSRTTTVPTILNFTGKMYNAMHQQAGLKALLVKTDTGYMGVIQPTKVDTQGDNNGVFVNIDSSGAFTATNDDGHEKLVITGTLSSDGKTLSGSFTSQMTGEAATQGMFSLKRS